MRNATQSNGARRTIQYGSCGKGVGVSLFLDFVLILFPFESENWEKEDE
jgi:hypothetical protein